MIFLFVSSSLSATIQPGGAPILQRISHSGSVFFRVGRCHLATVKLMVSASFTRTRAVGISTSAFAPVLSNLSRSSAAFFALSASHQLYASRASQCFMSV